jgi:streptogramin lyase
MRQAVWFAAHHRPYTLVLCTLLLAGAWAFGLGPATDRADTRLPPGPPPGNWAVGAAAFARDAVGKLTRVRSIRAQEERPCAAASPASVGPRAIAVGRDGDLWILEMTVQRVAHMDLHGRLLAEFPLPAGAGASDIAVDGHGNIWWVSTRGANVGRMSPAGQAEVFPVPGGMPITIVAGPDGRMWFTNSAGHSVDAIASDGAIQQYRLPSEKNRPTGLALGPDGALWYTDRAVGRVGRLAVDGSVREFKVPGTDPWIWHIAAGTDGNMWYTDAWYDYIGRMTTSGAIKKYQLEWQPDNVVPGPNRSVWFVEAGRDIVGQINRAGKAIEYKLPHALSWPFGLVAAPDGNVWFTEYFGDRVGRITPAGVVTEFALPQR